MEKKNNTTVKISVETLELILKPASSFALKVESLLKDHYLNSYSLPPSDLLSVLEVKISSEILIAYLKELVEQAKEAETETLYMLPEEVKLISSLSTALSLSSQVRFSGTNLLEH